MVGVWKTLGMSAAVVAASAVNLFVPSGTAVWIGGSSQFVPFPAGTVAGDFIVITYESGWTVLTPSGWTQNYGAVGGNGSGEVISKIMTSGDITAGGVTLTTSGGSFPGGANVVRFPGGGSIRTITGGGYGASGYTSTTLTAITFNAGEIALWMAHQRVDADQSCSRGTLGARQHASNASNGWWWDLITSTASNTATFTSPSAGANQMTLGLAIVAP